MVLIAAMLLALLQIKEAVKLQVIYDSGGIRTNGVIYNFDHIFL